MVISIIFAIFGFLFLLLSVGIINKLPNKVKLLKRYPKIRWATFSVSIILLLISGYYQFIRPLSIDRNKVFVTPNSFHMDAGAEKTFIMKLTNDKDINIYAVHILIEIVSKDLTADHIKIEPLGEHIAPGLSHDNKGGVSFDLDVIVMHAIPKGSKRKEPTLIDMIVNNINPNTTRDFKVSLNSTEIKEISKLNLKVSQFSKNPDSVYKGKSPTQFPRHKRAEYIAE